MSSLAVLVVGVGNLLIGAAYGGLGLLSAWEAISQYRYRGLSRFGLGFTLMAASCGPHHLAHGWCVLQGGAVSSSMWVATLIGLPAGTLFCWLRAEAMLGGRGDRTFAASARMPAAFAVVFAIAVGALAARAAAMPPQPGMVMCNLFGIDVATLPRGAGMASVASITNLCAAGAYFMVGWYLFVTQVRRHVAGHPWSVSGLALSAVFPTCALMHIVHALSFDAHAATLPFDLLGVPASIYFLWVVRQVHRDSVTDWNRRPLAGVAGTPDRSSPWHSAR